MQTEIIERAQKIKLLLMDCDGVLTDGRLYYTPGGEEIKVFHVRDGQGLVMWHKAGFHSGIISGRSSDVVKVRASEIGIHFVRIGSKDKVSHFYEISRLAGVEADEVAYIGDDLPDIDLIRRVGFGIAVADAAPEVFPFASYTTKAPGGLGAVREVTDLLLKAKGLL